MTILRRLAIALIGLLVLVTAAGAMLPRAWRIERAVIIAAPPERVYPLLASLRRWQDWSVWTKELDPQVRSVWEGPESGVGAKRSWLGPTMGRGRTEITAAHPSRGIEVDGAIESDTVNARAALTLRPEGAGTRLTWVDEGTLPPVLGGWFKPMVEGRLGRNLEVGLERLKALVEAQPPAAHERSGGARLGVDGGS
jgi:hypothetical protein